MSEKVKAFIVLAVVVFFVALVGLISCGVVDADNLTKAVTAVLAIMSAVLAWWKNNNITDAAAQAQRVLDSIKENDSQNKAQ